jgi:hypothetical protein
MAARRVNPGAVKMHRSYTAGELAVRLGVHKNTVRNWQREGLAAIDRTRPLLFQGQSVREFLSRRNASRKSPCPPGTLYCLRCRAPRMPALGMVDYFETKPGTGNLRALCEACEAIMHRRTRRAALAAVMPGIAVQVRLGPERLSGRASPSLNCDGAGQGAEP